MISIKRLARLAVLPALASLAVASVTAIAVRPSDSGEASSHREAPLISADPLADTTDVYAYLAPDSPDKLTLIANWIPLEEPAGGPNFFNFGDDVTYEFDIDNDGDAVEDYTYRFKFKTTVQDPTTFLAATGPITTLDDPNFNIRQTYSVYRQQYGSDPVLLASGLASPPNNIGPVSTPDYEDLAAMAVHDLPGGGKVFAGQRDDPFFVDLGAVFDLAQLRAGALDGVGGFNTHSIVLQVPLASITACGCDPEPDSASAVLGVWSDTYRSKTRVLDKNGAPKNNGPEQQVSRLGNPLVNEVVIPLSHKDRFNASEPKNDAQFGSFVLNSDLAAKLNAVYGFNPPIPVADRTDLATVFLTGIPALPGVPNYTQPPNVVPSEQIRINAGIKPADCPTFSTLGALGGDICGFPNGRRLADDVTDIELRAVTCGYGFAFGPCPASFPNVVTGDGVDGNDVEFLDAFPYVGTPHDGVNHEHHTGSVIVPVSAGLGAALAMLGLLIIGGQAASRLRLRHETAA